jgi:hypothetical protein
MPRTGRASGADARACAQGRVIAQRAHEPRLPGTRVRGKVVTKSNPTVRGCVLPRRSAYSYARSACTG